MLHLVLYLTTDDRASVAIQQSLYLLPYLPVQSSHQAQVLGVIAPDLEGLGQQPVGQTAIAYFTMTEGPHTHYDLHAVPLA